MYLALVAICLINEYMDNFINIISLPLLVLLHHLRLRTVIQEVHRLRVEIQTLEKSSQQPLEVSQHLGVLLIEVHPDLHPIERLHVLRGDEPEPVNVLRKIEILPQEVKDQIGVDLVLIRLLLTHGEDEAAALLIPRILPLGLDALLEVLDRVDPAPFVLHQVSACLVGYVCCLLLLCSKKRSRLLRW